MRSGRIVWDADVVILGGTEGSPLLVIDAAGNVLAARAIQVINAAGNPVTPVVGLPVPLDAAGGITVAAIANGGYGDIRFAADDDIANGTYNGTGSPPWPTFEFRDTLGSVVVIDASNLALTIRAIDVVAPISVADPVVELAPNNDTATTLRQKATIKFDLKHSAAPSLVDIEKRGIGTITLTAVVNNPIGLTRIVNLTRSILDGGAARIVTNLLDLAALDPTNGTIGSSSQRIEVDLVKFIALPRVDGPSVAGVRAPRLVVAAAVDAFLSLRGLDRATTETEMLVSIDSITAGRDVDVEIRTAQRQPGTSETGDVIVRVVLEASIWGTTVVRHSFRFRSDGNTTVGGAHDPTPRGGRRSSTLPCTSPPTAPSTSTPTCTSSNATSSSPVPRSDRRHDRRHVRTCDGGRGVRPLRDDGDARLVAWHHRRAPP